MLYRSSLVSNFAILSPVSSLVQFSRVILTDEPRFPRAEKITLARDTGHCLIPKPDTAERASLRSASVAQFSAPHEVRPDSQVERFQQKEFTEMKLKKSAWYLALFAASTCFAQMYTVTDLGPLSPTGINTWGQVVGNYNNHAFMWTRTGGTKDLGIPPGGTFSAAAAINDLGGVTGTADGPGTLISQFPEFPNVQCSDLTQPFIWTPRTGMQALGVPKNLPNAFLTDGSPSEKCDAAASYGRDINDSYQVVGDVPDGPNEYALALLWTSADGMTAFGDTWPPTFGNGINNSGEIVGQNSGTQCEGKATTWKSSLATDLGTLDAGGVNFYVSAANGVNDLGLVVGWSTTGPAPIFDSSPVHAVLWKPSAGIRDLGTLPGDTSSAASKINFFGQAVGTSGNTVYECDGFADSPFQVLGRPFIWSERSGMRDLNTLIRANSGWVLKTATDINFWGQIVGSGTRNGQQHGFLLTPRVFFQF
jgi:probable HAF family extracellular repeat protein